MTDIDVGQLSEALNDKLDIDAMNSTSATGTGLNDAGGVRTIVSVSDKSILPSWWRVYSDGWCEQGGHVRNTGSSVTKIDFIKPYASTTSYTLVAGVISNNYNNSTYRGVSIDYEDSPYTHQYSDGFNVYTHAVTSMDWQASGYIE